MPEPPPTPSIPAKGAFRVYYKTATGTRTAYEWPRDPLVGTLEEDLFWSGNSQLLLGFGYDGSVLSLVGSLGGDPARTSEGLPLSVTFASGYNFNRLSFRGQSGEVVSFRWFGGQTATSASSFQTMKDRFQDLTFL